MSQDQYEIINVTTIYILFIVKLGKHRNCWCHGSLCRQVSNNDIEGVRCRTPCLPWGRLSNTCVILVLMELRYLSVDGTAFSNHFAPPPPPLSKVKNRLSLRRLSIDFCNITGLLPDTWNGGLRMPREWRERFPRHWLQRKPLVSDPGMHHGTYVTHLPWCMSGSQTSGGGENVPGIPGACATHNFTYLTRGPLATLDLVHHRGFRLSLIIRLGISH